MKQPRVFGLLVLAIGHMAGLIDLVALPVWVGVLVARYQLGPALSGAVVTCFLLGVVGASLVTARQFDRLPHRLCAAGGFAVSAASFLAVNRLPVGAHDFASLAVLHALAGLGTGVALSTVHGTIGRTATPQRLFGICNVALGVLGVVFFATVPALIARSGPHALFGCFAAVMALAALAAAAAFPEFGRSPEDVEDAHRSWRPPVPVAAWLVVLVVVCLSFNQAMVFSFFGELGAARGFPSAGINGVLIALGLVNLLPGGIAAALAGRVSPVAVGVGGAITQAALALILTNVHAFAPFAAAGTVYVSVVIFTQTFLFGLLSRLDGSGRSVAGTPAMLMTGSCTGPAVAGLIVQVFGYTGLGWAAAAVSLVALFSLAALRRSRGALPVALAVARG